MKPVLKAPGTNRLKLKYDDPLSIFAFNFNLRRHILDERAVSRGDQLTARPKRMLPVTSCGAMLLNRRGFKA
jgi:hypothetical protein